MPQRHKLPSLVDLKLHHRRIKIKFLKGKCLLSNDSDNIVMLFAFMGISRRIKHVPLGVILKLFAECVIIIINIEMY